MRIELQNASEDDYRVLGGELKSRGFLHGQNKKAERAAQYTFAGDLDAETVAKMAQQSAMKTSRRFLIFVSDSNSEKGVGIAG